MILEASDMSFMIKKKKPWQKSDIYRLAQFIQDVINLRKLRDITEQDCKSQTCSAEEKAVHVQKDLEESCDLIKVKAKQVQAVEVPSMLCSAHFFPNVKNFDENQKVKRRNYKWL